MTDIVVVFVTVGNSEDAARIGRAVVEERLAACANIIPQIRSLYWWKGEICDEQETLLIMKTPSSMFPTLKQRVRELHTYELPEIIAMPVSEGLPEYLDWVAGSTGKNDA